MTNQPATSSHTRRTHHHDHLLIKQMGFSEVIAAMMLHRDERKKSSTANVEKKQNRTPGLFSNTAGSRLETRKREV